MREFTPQMTAALTDLFMATGGQVGRFYAVPDAALATYEALLRYRLVVLQNHEAGLVTRWTAALIDLCLDSLLEIVCQLRIRLKQGFDVS